MRNYWKIGCNWGKGSPDFYELLKKKSIVIYADKRDMQIGDIVAITKGYRVVAIAEITGEKLPLTNEIRLGLFLNMSVLYYGNIKDHQKAKKITKSVIEEVKGPIQKLDEEENKGIIRIYNLLKENLDMWEEE